MSARLLTGQEPAELLLDAVRKRCKELDPHLVILLVGDFPASETYVRRKMEAAAKVGMRATLRRFQSNVSPDDLLHTIRALNAESDVSGYILQLPLPPHLETIQPLLFKAFDAAKDVDGFTAYNLGKLLLSREFEHLPPATPAGIIRLLEHYKIPLEGRSAVLIGQSMIVGKPLSMMLQNRGVTTINCDIATPPALLRDLALRYGDLLVSAVGHPALVTRDMVKPGAVVLDVGFSVTGEGIRGDVAPDVAEVASAITPVPGGVGPMTVAHLLWNCTVAKERKLSP